MPPTLSHVRTFSSQNATILDATGSSSSPNTTVAMSILYTVTGCVSFLFFMIIISGAIKAIRHPERYGPRRNRDGVDGWSQTRAGGLTRAILDTFPIIKFGSTTQETPESPTDDDKPHTPGVGTQQSQSLPASGDGGTSLNPDEKIESSSAAEGPAEVPVSPW
ncbi:RING-7 protein [Mycena sanguinolenta]|uniref:RING-7 protein n=1 Tax=Mycena sanguinolenta TaxID=230812 RepID=A0A8H7DJ40_9AGAR|nr:RING-7 protein [Mycena sanguinolenta]